MEGPSGIGKSELIDRFLDEEPELTVLRASGEQWEAFVAYGVADQLMRVAGVGTARLLAGRERSLPPEEPVGVGGRILEIIENLELKAPVVIVLDDAHWADVDSLRALLFVARRLVEKRVLTLLVQRTDEAARLPEGLRRMATGRTGSTVRLQALTSDEVSRLATALGSPRLSSRAAEWLHTHTEGNPFYVATLLAELPADSWCGCEPALSAPRAFVVHVARRLVACSPSARRLVEATAVLGASSPLASVTALAEVADLVDALDEATDLNLLRISDEIGISRLRFSHPLVQPAVYELLGPARRIRLHAGAAVIVEDEAAALRHRAMASIQPNAGLANDLETYARHESTVGAWAHAAWALAEGSRLSPGRRQRELRLLRAVDAMISAGDLIQAEAFARGVAAFAPGPLRDSTVGYLAMLHGRAGEAEHLLHAAWEQADPVGQPEIAAVVAQRLALHEVGRLRGREVVDWARRAVELSPADDPVRVEAEALLGIGLGWLGRVPEGLANCESVLARLGEGHDGPPAEQVQVADGWLRLVADDVEGAQAELAQTAPAVLRSGSTGTAVWAYVWLARTRFIAGAWDAAAADAERAVSLLEQSGHEWLGPLVRLTATLVPAARGEWAAAEEHAREATDQPGDYELMVLAAALAQRPGSGGSR